ncbi:MAG: DUF4007 family protein [Prochlorotrichaceae cyanobacterium]|jgi:hypothetical protein
MAQSTQLSIATLNTITKSTFARHETFHPRFGWLKKGFDRAAANPAVFLAEDATVQLGVGKNMVRSIRYWCGAFKLLEDDRPTAFGQKLLGEHGWDSYLEDPASLWLLHWKLLEEPCTATAWKIVFNEVNKPEFTEDEILEILERYRGGNTAISSFKKDVSCLLRMYVKQTRSQKSLVSEESLDCPFAELGLIDRFEDNQVKRSYQFRLGYKLTLTTADKIALSGFANIVRRITR